MSLAACALLLLNQATAAGSGVTFLTADQVERAIQTAPPERPGVNGLWTTNLSATPGYQVIEVRRTIALKSEVHANMADVWYVLRGGATLVTGGTLVDPTEVAPGETRGNGVTGGEPRPIHPGDVVVVPPGVPHWISQVTGKEVVYLVVKVPSAK